MVMHVSFLGFIKDMNLFGELITTSMYCSHSVIAFSKHFSNMYMYNVCTSILLINLLIVYYSVYVAELSRMQTNIYLDLPSSSFVSPTYTIVHDTCHTIDTRAWEIFVDIFLDTEIGNTMIQSYING